MFPRKERQRLLGTKEYCPGFEKRDCVVNVSALSGDSTVTYSADAAVVAVPLGVLKAGLGQSTHEAVYTYSPKVPLPIPHDCGSNMGIQKWLAPVNGTKDDLACGPVLCS